MGKKGQVQSMAKSGILENTVAVPVKLVLFLTNLSHWFPAFHQWAACLRLPGSLSHSRQTCSVELCHVPKGHFLVHIILWWQSPSKKQWVLICVWTCMLMCSWERSSMAGWFLVTNSEMEEAGIVTQWNLFSGEENRGGVSWNEESSVENEAVTQIFNRWLS